MNDTKRAVVTVSFGTAEKNACEKSIGSIEHTLSKAFFPIPVFRAFTGKTVIKIIKSRGENAKTLSEVLTMLSHMGFEEILIQPTHVINGPDWQGVKDEAMSFSDNFKAIIVSKPLLKDSYDCALLARALSDETERHENDKDSVVFVGHGAGDGVNSVYIELRNALCSLGKESCFVAALHGEPSLTSIIPSLKALGRKDILLVPLMISAGSHVKKDMAGTWSHVLKNEGFNVSCLFKGLGEYDKVRQLILKHAEDAAIKHGFFK